MVRIKPCGRLRMFVGVVMKEDESPGEMGKFSTTSAQFCIVGFIWSVGCCDDAGVGGNYPKKCLL